MAKLIVSEKIYDEIYSKALSTFLPGDGDSDEFKFLTGLIPDPVAQQMIRRFGHARFFKFPTTHYFTFLNEIDNLPSRAGWSKAIVVRAGRDGVHPELNLTMEPMYYQYTPAISSGFNYIPLPPADFFGRSSIDLKVDHRGQQGIDDLNRSVRVPDRLFRITLMILIDFNILKEFSGEQGDFDELRIHFARNLENRLTVLLFRSRTNGTPVPSTVAGSTGIYLDDNDLLP